MMFVAVGRKVDRRYKSPRFLTAVHDSWHCYMLFVTAATEEISGSVG